MSEHKVTLKWERGGAEFSYQKYPRDHTWSFDGGHTMTASAAPAYLGNPANVDPEEAFVAPLSSCHMLTFLSIACHQKFVLDQYTAETVGHMEKNAEGRDCDATERVPPSPSRTSISAVIDRRYRNAFHPLKSRVDNCPQWPAVTTPSAWKRSRACASGGGSFSDQARFTAG